MGTLRIKAKIDLNQFWPGPNGIPSPQLLSDGDTAGVIVKPDGVEFQVEPDGPFVVSHVFDKARAKSGNQSNRVINDAGRLKVRFQGVDTPELHVEPRKPEDLHLPPEDFEEFKRHIKPYRQQMAETAANALHTRLSQGGGSILDCLFITQVDEPNDVFDMFGRAIGDLIVRVAGEDLVVNRWLLEEGWAFPSFYLSMTVEEIKSLSTLSKEARARGAGLWSQVAEGLTAFDHNLIYRGAGVPLDPAADLGAVMNPKIFRRQATWFALLKAHAAPPSFLEYLRATNESFQLASELFVQGIAASQPHRLGEMLDDSGKFVYSPEEVVFFESASTLVDENGVAITHW